MEGSRELIEELKRRGHTAVLASSAKADEVDHYLELLEARELADGWTTSADVEADQAGARPGRRGARPGAVQTGGRGDGRRHAVGRPCRAARGRAKPSRC